MATTDKNLKINVQIKGGDVSIPQQSVAYNMIPLFVPTPPTAIPIPPPVPAVANLNAFGNACIDSPSSATQPFQTLAPPPGLSNPVDWLVYIGTCADATPCPQTLTSAVSPYLLGTPLLVNTFPITGTGESYLTLLEQYGPTNTNLAPPAYYPDLNTLVDIDYATGDFTAQGELTTWSAAYTGYSITDVNYIDSIGYSTFATQSDGILLDDIEYMSVAPPGICNGIAMSALTKQEVLMGVVEAPEVQSEVFIERGKQSVFERIQRFGEIHTIGGLLTYGYGFNNIKEEITNG